MKRGILEVIVGPMYAGKSSEIMKRVLWHKHKGDNVTVLKPQLDDRYTPGYIQTHDGHKIEVWTVNTIEAEPLLTAPSGSKPGLVVIDEIQFFHDTYYVIEVIEEILKNGVDVIVAGLDQDSRGIPWPTSGAMLALADTVVKLTALCHECGRPATKTYRTISDGDRVQVGSVGMYEARCGDHWESR